MCTDCVKKIKRKKMKSIDLSIDKSKDKSYEADGLGVAHTLHAAPLDKKVA